MVQIKVNKWNSLVQQVEENRQNILTLSEQLPQFDTKGEWNNTTVYAKNDMISYSGASYFSLQDANANHTPGATESAAWWQLLAAKGETGAQGAKGETGPTGPEGDPGPGVYGASIVDSKLYVHSPFVNAPAQGDLIIVDADKTTDANIGNMYIVNNPTGTSHIPLSNVQLTGNIRGPQGPTGPRGHQGPVGPTGNSTYCHYITFEHNYSDGGRGRAALILVNHSNIPFSSSLDLCEAINSFPSTTYIPITIEAKATGGTGGSSGNRAAFIKSEGNAMPSCIRISTGYGIDMPPDDEAISSSQIQNLYDYVV